MRNSGEHRTDHEFLWFAVLLLIVLATSVTHGTDRDSSPSHSDLAARSP